MKLSSASKKLKENPMADLAGRVAVLEQRGRRIIHFEIGEPDFKTPPHIVRAAIASLGQGETRYANARGLTKLREAIALQTKRELGFCPSPDQIIVAPGLSLIYFLLCCIADPGDEVVVPDPGFSPYYSILRFIGLRPVAVPLQESNAFRMNPDDIRLRLSKKSKLVIVNSPHNPTGAVTSPQEIAGITRLAYERDLYVLSDEVYSKIIYEEKHCSPATTDRCQNRTIVLNSFSKSYAMTGWRLGYIIGPSKIITKMSLLIQNTIYSVPVFIQRAGISALSGSQRHLQSMVEEYRKRRDLLVAGLNRLPGISCITPGGAFYVFPNIKKTGMTSEQFAKFMLDQAGVALLPGSTFGKAGEGYVRLCYAVSRADIAEGLRRMERALKRR